MTEEKEASKRVSRRQFVKGAAVGGAGVAAAGVLASCAPAATPAPGQTAAPAPTCPPAGECPPFVDPNVPETWDKEADVVVLGYGGTGATAAITAYDEGAQVLLLEKMAEPGGTTNLTGGFLNPTDVDTFVKYVKGLFEFSHAEMDEAVIQAYAEEAVKNVDWVVGLKEGTECAIYGYAGYPEVAGSESIEKYQVLEPGGKVGTGGPTWAGSLFRVLQYAVEQRDIEVLLGTPAKRLVTNLKGEVIGVIAESQGEEIAIKAKRGVILATGGHGNNPTMLSNHSQGYPIYYTCNPGNQGDGTMMAEKVGAALWHMNGLSCPIAMHFPEFEAGFSGGTKTNGYIYVDQNAERFVNEKGIDGHHWILVVNHFDDETLSYPRIPCFNIFDETARLAGGLGVGAIGWNRDKYEWSEDNSVEIEKGWIKKGDTIGELAVELGLDPAVLEETIQKWNVDVTAGTDTLFGRPVLPPEEERPAYIGRELPILSIPIETPPYYGVELYPCIINSQGGPKKNDKGQTVDPFGAPIPRLYQGGELGGMWGMVYQGAGNIGEALTYGRISGRNAAAETPWE